MCSAATATTGFDSLVSLLGCHTYLSGALRLSRVPLQLLQFPALLPQLRRKHVRQLTVERRHL